MFLSGPNAWEDLRGEKVMENIPVVLIVGRPNVGKSTLFNRLVGRPASLVFDRPGVTRDLVEAELDLGDFRVHMMDSAGWPYPGEDQALNKKINEKVERTMKICDLILWVVDGRAGRTGAEDALAERVAAYRKKTVLLINKLDEFENASTSWADAEFAGLPWSRALPITAKHGRGFADLLELLESELGVQRKKSKKSIASEDTSESSTDDSERISSESVLKLCVLGRPNVGKSTLVNFLLKQDRVVVSDRPGTTRDAIETAFRYDGREIVLVDTPGVRRADRITDGLERTMSRISLITSQTADVGLLILDISQGLAEQDLRLVTHLWDKGVTTVVAANKWDVAFDRASQTAKALEDEFRRRMFGAHAVPFVLISAKTGHGIDRLMKTIFEAEESSRRRIRTPDLNRRLQEWNSDFPTGLFQGKIGKLKYAVQTRTSPMAFKIFVNDKKAFRREALSYLEKRFRESFGLHHAPILLHLAQSPSKRSQKSSTRGD